MVAGSCQVLVPGAADYELAKGYIQHFATKLKAGDALHLAIASNHGATMAQQCFTPWTKGCWLPPGYSKFTPAGVSNPEAPTIGARD